MRLRLRTRVALSFAALSVMVAGTVSLGTYAFARWYLVGQRESTALTRAVLDSRAADAAMSAGAVPSDALDQVPSVGTSQPMIQSRETWYTRAVTVSPSALPQELLTTAVPNGAHQRVTIAGDPYYVVAIPIDSGLYVEVFPLRDLNATLTVGGWILVGLSMLAAALGAVIGETAVGRILGPVHRLGAGARRLAGGELSTRIAETGDPDLDPIAESFNDMADAIQTRIARERRFTANVSHELRSPLTSVVGTAELLERRRDELPERDAAVVTVLLQQVRRMSRMLLDLLEISRITADDPIQWEATDVGDLCRDVIRQRGLDPALVGGDDVSLRTDARRLERIVGNLVDNAERHGGGVVRVVVERDATAVRVIVDDAGPGIDESMRARLFEPFARGESTEKTEGAGLGLAIVQEQATALGGGITIETSPEGGARFVAQLPDKPEAR